jgi:hypothetical protein
MSKGPKHGKRDAKHGRKNEKKTGGTWRVVKWGGDAVKEEERGREM